MAEACARTNHNAKREKTRFQVALWCNRQLASLVSVSYTHLDVYKRQRYAWSIAACLLTTALTAPLQKFLDLANIVMLFLLCVVLVAVRLGRGPAMLAAVVSVAAFDFFYVQPHLSFAVSDVQYLVTFAVMLAVGLIIGQLTARLQFAADAVSYTHLDVYKRQVFGRLCLNYLEAAEERLRRRTTTL